MLGEMDISDTVCIPTTHRKPPRVLKSVISYSDSSGRTVSLKLILLLAEGLGTKQYVTPRTHNTILGFCMAKGLLFTGMTFLEVLTGPSGTESCSFHRTRNLFHLVLQLCPGKKKDLLLNTAPSSCAN